MFVSAGAMLGQESKIEYTFDNQNGTNKADMNISYVEAYCFSIMCTCSDGVKTGCDIPLSAKHQCVEPDHLNAAGACVNSTPDFGPASDFLCRLQEQGLCLCTRHQGGEQWQLPYGRLYLRDFAQWQIDAFWHHGSTHRFSFYRGMMGNGVWGFDRDGMGWWRRTCWGRHSARRDNLCR